VGPAVGDVALGNVSTTERTRPEKRHHGHAKRTPEYRRSARAPSCRPAMSAYFL
jgi:hypothetical protein